MQLSERIASMAISPVLGDKGNYRQTFHTITHTSMDLILQIRCFLISTNITWTHWKEAKNHQKQ